MCLLLSAQVRLPTPAIQSAVCFIYTSSLLTARPQLDGPGLRINPTMHHVEVIGFITYCIRLGCIFSDGPGVRHFGSLIIRHPGQGGPVRMISQHGGTLTPPNERVVGSILGLGGVSIGFSPQNFGFPPLSRNMHVRQPGSSKLATSGCLSFYVVLQ